MKKNSCLLKKCLYLYITLKQITMYENYYYLLMTTQELEMVVYDDTHLDGYRKRCEQELIRRYQEEQEFTQL